MQGLHTAILDRFVSLNSLALNYLHLTWFNDMQNGS